MRILVTGGAGFIGSNLVRALAAARHEVIVADNLVTACSLELIEDVRDKITFVHADVRLASDFRRLPPGPYDRVYHLAASFANALSIEQPLLDRETNLTGTENALDHARREGCGLFVYTGSSSSYGDAPPPFTEDMPPRPYTPYAESKHLGEMCVVRSDLPFAVFRLFNVYGPGDLPGRFRNALPNMMKGLEGPEGRIAVFGREATRDFTYVADVVDVLLDAPRAEGKVVNIGTGVETGVLDVATKILKLFDRPANRLEIQKPRAWDRVARRAADVTRLRALFGRVPETPLDRGLAETARWLVREGHVRLPLP
jgi:UDP-glucose 4-epimerase